jgi:hypothetical protein
VDLVAVSESSTINVSEHRDTLVVCCFISTKTIIFLFVVEELERKLLIALEELKLSVAQNTRILQMLQASSIAAADVPDLPGDVQLPVATVRDLQLLDDKLHDDELLGKALVST